jgi:hypothetical protein
LNPLAARPHAEKDVRTDAISETVMDRSDLEVGGLESLQGSRPDCGGRLRLLATIEDPAGDAARFPSGARSR